MKIELKPYEKKYFFKYIFGVMNFRTLRNLGIFNPKIFFLMMRHLLFSGSENYKLMILYGGKVVGGVSIVNVSKGVYRFGIFIFRRYRNKGIGTKAIKELFAYGKKRGWKKFIANTFIKNIPVKKANKKAGLREIKRNRKDIFWEKKLK